MGVIPVTGLGLFSLGVSADVIVGIGVGVSVAGDTIRGVGNALGIVRPQACTASNRSEAKMARVYK